MDDDHAPSVLRCIHEAVGRNKSKQREIRIFNKEIDEMDGNIYKSVLHNLSLIPEEYMAQVNNFLKSLQKRSNSKEQNRKEILDLAGSWEDMGGERL